MTDLSLAMYPYNVLRTDVGGSSPQTRSMSASTGTTRPRSSSSTARTARRRACPASSSSAAGSDLDGSQDPEFHKPSLMAHSRSSAHQTGNSFRAAVRGPGSASGACIFMTMLAARRGIRVASAGH